MIDDVVGYKLIDHIEIARAHQSMPDDAKSLVRRSMTNWLPPVFAPAIPAGILPGSRLSEKAEHHARNSSLESQLAGSSIEAYPWRVPSLAA
jgi:hypothetical protein